MPIFQPLGPEAWPKWPNGEYASVWGSGGCYQAKIDSSVLKATPSGMPLVDIGYLLTIVDSWFVMCVLHVPVFILIKLGVLASEGR